MDCATLTTHLVFVCVDMDKIYGVSGRVRDETTLILNTGTEPIFHRDMLIFRNIDFTRATDIMTLLFLTTTIFVHIFGFLPRWLVFLEALAWRLVFSGIVGYVLLSEDRWQSWSRHYLKWGYTRVDAFNNWKP